MRYTKHRTKKIQRYCQRGVHKTHDEDKQSRDTVNVGYTKHRTKIIQRHCQRGVHKTQDEDKQSRDTVNVGYTRHRTKTNNLETLSTWGTQKTGRRQTIQRHCQRGVHKTQDEDKQSRDTVNVGYTIHRTKTIQRHCQRGVHKTQDEDNPETLSTWGTQDTGRRQTI